MPDAIEPDAIELEDPITGTAGPPPNLASNPPLESAPYDSNQQTDRARQYIAYWLLAILSVMVLFSFAILAWILWPHPLLVANNFDHLVNLLNVLFGPVVTLVGSAMGFYFGARTASQANAGANSNTRSTSPPTQ